MNILLLFSSFVMTARNVNNINYELTIKGLLFEINPTKSYVKVVSL